MSITTADVTIPDRAELLVVEDDQDILALYGLWLADAGSIRTATDGEEALGMLDYDVDVVVLDRKLPESSGEEVLAAINERDLSCQVVVVSGVEPDFDLVELTFDEYLVKPVTRVEVRDAVRRTLARAEDDRILQEFHELSKKRELLYEHKTVGERESSREYAALDARMAQLRDRSDDIARLDADDTPE